MIRHEFVTVTFRRDADFTRAMLASMAKFTSNFAAATIVVPEEDDELFKQIARKSPTSFPIYVRRYKEWPGKGHLNMLLEKHNADRHCPEATWIWHIDSDTIFIRPIAPYDFVQNSVALVVGQPYSDFLKYDGGPTWWFNPTKKALGWAPRWETMRCFPIVYHRLLYEAVRGHVANTVGKPFEQYMREGKNEFPQDRCEFNVLGNYAVRMQPRHHKICPPDSMYNYVWQAWSHGGIDRPLSEPPGGLAGRFPGRVPGLTPRQVFREFLGIEL